MAFGKRETSLQIIEKHYGMPIEDIVKEVHWKKGVPISRIAEGLGMNRGSVTTILRRLNIRVRTQQEWADYKKNEMWQNYRDAFKKNLSSNLD